VEVIMVKSRILLTVLALVVVLLATPYIGMAYAGKGQTKETFTLTMMGGPIPGTSRASGNSDIVQTRGEGSFAYYIEIDIGTNPPVFPDPALYSACVDSMMDTVAGDGTVRVKETIVFADGSTFVITASEKFTGLVAPYTSYSGSGSFEGHGTGALAGVKVQGTTNGYISLEYGMVNVRVGTVMGWPD